MISAAIKVLTGFIIGNLFLFTCGISSPNDPEPLQKIVFSSSTGGILSIFVMNSDGSNLTRITDSDSSYQYSVSNYPNGIPYNDVNPSWSPDGTKIVYQKTTDDGLRIKESDLYILDMQEMQSQQLTKTKEILEANPQWSPDGKNILFSDEITGVIYLIHLK